jgi:hypothetical protein
MTALATAMAMAAATSGERTMATAILLAGVGGIIWAMRSWSRESAERRRR